MASTHAVEHTQAGEGDAHPLGTVVELVQELVQRLLDQQGVQQRGQVVVAGRDEAAAIGGRQVGVEVARRGVRLPRPRAIAQTGRCAPALGRGVRERPQHAGDVAQRRTLEPPL